MPPKLLPGEVSGIATNQVAPDKFQARGRYCYKLDKQTRQVSATGATATKAASELGRLAREGVYEERLRRKLNKQAPAAIALAAVSAFSLDMTVLEQVKAAWPLYQEELGPASVKQYHDQIFGRGNRQPGTIVMVADPSGFMKLTTRQVIENPWLAKTYLDQFNSKPGIRTYQARILSKSFVLNPYAPSDPIEKLNKAEKAATKKARRETKKEVRAFRTAEHAEDGMDEREKFLNACATHFDARPRSDRAKFMDWQQLDYDLGSRISESLGVRWEDVDLDAVDAEGTKGVAVRTVGRLVQAPLPVAPGEKLGPEVVQWVVPGEGSTKPIDSAWWFVSDASASMLRTRKIAARPGAVHVFETSNGTPWAPKTVQDLWNKIVKGTEVEFSSSHTLRRTVATRVNKKYGREAAQQVLGHAVGGDVINDYLDAGASKPVILDFRKALE